MDISYYKKYEPIDGKWYINKELGSGAFGTVFEIERRDFTRAKSALKIITIPASPSEVKSYREENFELDEKSVTSYFYGFVEEFIKEFEVMLQLKGISNIVSIEDYDIKEHEGEIGWDIFIRMELLTPMNKYFSLHAMTSDVVINLGIDICKALEACQKCNIVHRDIKPSNIFVSDMGEFKLGDFGVARTLEKTSSGLSKKGTYTYMAPEVYKGEAYSSNVDIYSLGIVMYKLLNNNMEPYRKEKTHTDEENALVARLKGEAMPKPANADGRLAEIILKACAFNPKDRYESPRLMREELESILGGNVCCNQVENAIEVADENEETVGIFDAIPVQEDKAEEKTSYVFGNDEKTQGIFSLEEKNEVVAEKAEQKAEQKAEEKAEQKADNPADGEEQPEGKRGFVAKILKLTGLALMSCIFFYSLAGVQIQSFMTNVFGFMFIAAGFVLTAIDKKSKLAIWTAVISAIGCVIELLWQIAIFGLFGLYL